MKVLRNRSVLGIICIIFALIVCFGITPLVNRGLSSKTTIVRMKQNVSAGQQITEKMVEEVEVGKYGLPESVVVSKEDVVGMYVLCDLYKEDYILAEKISAVPAKENEYLYNLNGEKQAISVTISSFAEGLSGKLQSGDIVSVIVPDYENLGETVIPPELTYMEVIAVTAKTGYDTNTSEVSNEDEDKELPTTVTLLATPCQALVLASIEADSEMHLALVYRGSKENSAKFIEAQQLVLDEIQAKEEAEQMEESEEDLEEE